MTILEKLTTIFRQIFDRPDLVVTPETNASHVEGWDSFMHINLVVGIEEAFDVSFTTQEIGAFTCLGDVIQLLKEKALQNQWRKDSMQTISNRKLFELQPGLREEITVHVTQDQVAAYAKLSGDESPLHVDPEFARARGYSGPVAHGLLIGAFISQLVGTRLPGAGGLLQSCDLEFRKPLCPPAEIRIVGEVTHVSASTGQITLQVKVHQGETLVAQAKVKSIIRD